MFGEAIDVREIDDEGYVHEWRFTGSDHVTAGYGRKQRRRVVFTVYDRYNEYRVGTYPEVVDSSVAAFIDWPAPNGESACPHYRIPGTCDACWQTNRFGSVVHTEDRPWFREQLFLIWYGSPTEQALSTLADELRPSPFPNADRFRVADSSVPEQVAEFEHYRDRGCCVEAHYQLGPSPTGRTYLYGFNYGH